MNLEPGMRVRCVDFDPTGSGKFLDLHDRSRVYQVSKRCDSVFINLNGYGDIDFAKFRFKPIVRVKAPTRRYCCNKGCTGCRDFAFRIRLHRFATSGDR